jgi:hypothetical protein
VLRVVVVREKSRTGIQWLFMADDKYTAYYLLFKLASRRAARTGGHTSFNLEKSYALLVSTASLGIIQVARYKVT